MEEFKYQCELCQYKCKTKCNWHHHINTLKHLKKCADEDDLDDYDYICKHCSKMYKSRSGLWNHNKICNPKLNDDIDNTDTINIPKEVWYHMIQESSEFKALLMESMKNTNSMIATNNNSNSNNSNSNNNINTTNNTVNNHFNLQFFLNEQCKDAININEFIESINITFDDLENTAKYGYVDGVTQIIINHLRELDIFKRPIHCSDAKRGILYFKHDNKWEKDQEEKPIAKHVVRAVSAKNIVKIQDWIHAHPGCTQSDSMKNRLYHKIYDNAMSGDTKEEQNNNLDKVIRNLIREVAINKKMVS